MDFTLVQSMETAEEAEVLVASMHQLWMGAQHHPHHYSGGE